MLMPSHIGAVIWIFIIYLMKKFYLIRHAQSESNAGLVIRENHLINLTDPGRTQAQNLCDWLCDYLAAAQETISGVFISPYIRTQQTALPYLQKTGFDATVMPSLQEFNILEFERIFQRELSEIRTMAQAFWQLPNDHKDGDSTDSFDDFVARVRTARHAFSEMADGSYVVFGHGMWIGMLIWQLLHQDSKQVLNKATFATYELTIRPDNCDVYLLTIDNHTQSIAKLRDNRGGVSVVM